MKQIAVLETTQGAIEIELLPNTAPKATENFVTHIKNGYYDGLIFHRVIKNFMIQGGDPTGSGRGGESIWKAPFEDEFDVAVNFSEPYLLAMANAGPKTNGSQFFITTVPTPWLDNRHTIFGRVIKGQEVVKKIESVAADAFNKPIERQEIKKATIKEVEAK
ncbi:MAG: peptidylprolyl isomerase [Helicobacteraceae bacterium]|nr:peptidylprolyl isomerase [Helicobacteraceae bacterium]